MAPSSKRPASTLASAESPSTPATGVTRDLAVGPTFVPYATPLATANSDGASRAAASALHANYNAQTLYTRIGSLATVAVAAPSASAALAARVTDSATADHYAKVYKSLATPPSDGADPHIYGVANETYFALRRTGVDQAIVLSGEAGAGKTTHARLLVSHLARIAAASPPSKRDEKLAVRIAALNVVLSTLGSASLPHSPDASRLGTYAELQYTARGKLAGVKTIVYALDRERVTRQRLGERNFHAFYALVHGAPADIKSALGVGTNPGQVLGYLNYGADMPATPGSLRAGPHDDVARFAAFADALKTLGLSKRASHAVYKVLAAILHLAQITFETDPFSGDAGSCIVKQPESHLSFVADLLEVDPTILAATLTAHTQLVGRDLVTQLLTAERAAAHRDTFAQTLYHVVVAWVIEQANKKMCADDSDDSAANGGGGSFVAVVDFPGVPSSSANKAADAAAAMPAAHAIAASKLDALLRRRMFEYGVDELRAEGVPSLPSLLPVAPVATGALLAAADVSASALASAAVLPGDFVNLMRGGNGRAGSRSPAMQAMFGDAVLNLDAYERHSATVVRAKTMMRRTPSMKRRPATNAKATGGAVTELASVDAQVDALVEALDATQVRAVYCIAPNRTLATATAWDSKAVRAQCAALAIGEVAAARAVLGDYSVRFAHADFVARYSPLVSLAENEAMAVSLPRTAANSLLQRLLGAAAAAEWHVGPSLVLVRDAAWARIEAMLRKAEADAKGGNKRMHRPSSGALGGAAGAGTDLGDDMASVYSDAATDDAATDVGDDMASVYSDGGYRNTGAPGSFPMGRMGASATRATEPLLGTRNLPGVAAGDTVPADAIVEEEEPVSGSRRRWVCLTWFMTWWIPSFCLTRCGGMKREDVRMAWREKVTICILIFFTCAFQLFIIIGLGRVVCPKQNIMNTNELFFSATPNDKFVGIYGGVYSLTPFYEEAYHSRAVMDKWAGLDITAGFPRTPQYYCSYAAQFAPDFNSLTTFNARANGTFIAERHHEFYETDLYQAQYRIDWKLRQNLVATVGWDPTTIKAISTNQTAGNRLMFIVGNRVYDLSTYMNAVGASSGFLPIDLIQYLSLHRGQDLTSDKTFRSIWNKDRGLRDCFNNLFIAGTVDYRKSARCQITNYVLLAFSVLLVAVIGGKFLAALQVSSDSNPENFDKFVILNVPCYTEGEDSLRDCIESLARTRYDDKRKLLFIVCDGNIMGSGNDRPTPRIVLDILNVDPAVDPEPLSFQSLGDGMRQHNMAKIYSGLYESMGHLVPYIVVVKVGKPSESSKPGNRGKRDSQMILMRFLNKVAGDGPMSPLELEMYHQIKNVIGVNPAFYEYALMVDADTVVFPDSLTRLVAAMMHDTQVMGVCGETRLSNEKDTWSTMIQVYEYYISHHLAKAFESLFGSVTCLPGCFSMYRIRSHNKSTPLLVSNDMIQDYGETKVDTLHKKNLLHLGEDRYLTTLMLKNFPRMKTIFTPDAQCITTAPDSWDVLLSQRRRWINSTIHNLVELLGIAGLCGFCCFSMRFVVLLDLVGTLVQPAILGYLGYLGYMVVIAIQSGDYAGFPVVSLLLLGVVYGLQAIIFLIKREWQHIGWMIIYIFAIPVFSFFIPVYSFWKNDDFSWGSTRIVIGEAGAKKVMLSGEEAQKFNMDMIPHRKWSEYEHEALATMHDASADHASQYSGKSGHFGNGNGGGMDRRTTIQSRSSIGSGLTLTGGGPSAASGSPRALSLGGSASDLRRVNTTRTTGTEFDPVALYLPGSSPSAAALLGGMPSDSELYSEVLRIVASADLMTMTKKSVRDELSALFGVDLTARKEFINQAIVDALQQRQ